ncbi:MAG: glycosyl transferase, partial [Verrucomicrobiae bacterium]|nr:glycosyl transferase [Verrucomicrobiae bacterium]
MKWGTMYGPEYVNILYSMIARNITGPFELFCFTDDPTGIRPEVRCYPLPELGCEIPPDVPGKWRKQALWGKTLFDLEGVALFLDLDCVIVDNIDGYFEYGKPDDVITARNWVHPFRKHAQTSVFRFRIGSHPYMLDDLRADPAGISRRYQMEQNYVTAHIRGGVKFWPEAWTKH